VTIVAAIRTSKGTFIGSDSLASNGELCATTPTPKVHRVHDYLIGFAGSWRAGQQCVAQAQRLNKPTLRDIIDFETSETDWNLLIVENHRLWEVSSDRGLIEAEDYLAIGSGASVCLGALAMVSSRGLRPADLEAALTVTSWHTTTVAGPFHILEL
jgi:ATP-dependent protease HslVU (ClpYQ) peptidase subunit